MIVMRLSPGIVSQAQFAALSRALSHTRLSPRAYLHQRVEDLRRTPAHAFGTPAKRALTHLGQWRDAVITEARANRAAASLMKSISL